MAQARNTGTGPLQSGSVHKRDSLCPQLWEANTAMENTLANRAFLWLANGSKLRSVKSLRDQKLSTPLLLAGRKCSRLQTRYPRNFPM